MMRHLSRFAIVAVCSASALTGCQDSTAPTVVSTYVLRALGSTPVPAPEGASPDYLLVADTMRFRSDGIVTQTITRQMPDAAGATTRTHGTSTMHYTIDGSVVHFSVTCPPGADCIRTPMGTLIDSKLDMFYDPGLPPIYHFERISP